LKYILVGKDILLSPRVASTQKERRSSLTEELRKRL
jgi:hypothetical protein